MNGTNEQFEKIEPHDAPAPSRERDYLLPGSILIAALMISGSIIYMVGAQNRGAMPSQQGNVGAALAPEKALELSSRDVILGDPKAPVTFIEYGDYQCPYCARFFSGAEPQIRDVYVKTGKVRMVFRNLAFLGTESTDAALAAECAKDQGKFWAYHDAIYAAEEADGKERNGNLERGLFVKLAKDIGIADAAAFTSCFDGKKYASQIDKDNENARAAGADSTPTSFINGEKVLGAQPFSIFKAAIDQALVKK